MSPSSPRATAANEWRRLWSVGANGEALKKSTTKPNKTRTTKKKLRRKTPDNNNNTTTQTSYDILRHQQDIQGKNIDLEDVEEYGNKMQKKSDNILRIQLHNINRLPISGRTGKSRQLVNTIVHKQIDIALLTEIGLYWKKVPNNDQWHERVPKPSAPQEQFSVTILLSQK